MSLSVTQLSDDQLVVSKHDRGFALFCLGGLLLCVLVGSYRFVAEGRGFDNESVQGAVAGAILFVLLFLVFFERTRFVFDRQIRRLLWQRQRSWRRTGGEFPLDLIETVRVESPLGDEGIPSRRILLVTRDGTSIPITTAYTPDHEDRQLLLAARLRRFLGDDADDPVRAEVEAAIVAGRILEAVKLLREHEGLSLTEARSRVEEMRTDS